MDCNKNVKIDLHIHSTASDGTLSPSEILAMACHLNLGAIAITDHDTIDGSKEALRVGIPSSIQFLTGVEISATPPLFFSGSGSLHILGYGIRLEDPALNQNLGILQEARDNRNPRIIERLNSLGFDISLREVRDQVKDGQLGRPHIAQVMLGKKMVTSIREAFDEYLGKGGPAYVDKYRMDCSSAIETITSAGGIPVLAHPILLEYENNALLEDLVINLKSMGLQGIEVYYPEHSPEHMEYYTKLTERHDLLMTGGSDFHGSLKPNIKMGSGKGDLFIPYEVYEALKKAVEKGSQVKSTDLFELEQQLQYEFSDKNLLDEALNHSSFVNEQADKDIRDNECLEFLGDAVLNLVIGHILMKRFPRLKEGDLSRMRAMLVNESQLAIIAQMIDLGSYVRLGKGEIQTKGREKKSILADTYEAVIAAVYLDGGFKTVFKIIEANFIDFLESIAAPDTGNDYKSQLQEIVQVTNKVMPHYRVLKERGPDHDKTFEVQVTVGEVQKEGVGKSKKMAEQDAAGKALKVLT